MAEMSEAELKEEQDQYKKYLDYCRSRSIDTSSLWGKSIWEGWTAAIASQTAPEPVYFARQLMRIISDRDALAKAAEELLAHLYDQPNGQPPIQYVQNLGRILKRGKS